MEVHRYSSIKAIVATDIVKDLVKTQKGQVERKSARDIKKFRILPKNSAEGLGREHCLVTYLSMRIHPKSCCIFPLKVETTLIGGSRNGLIGA